MTFRSAYPVAWTFHRNTSRWPHNAVPNDEVDVNPDPPKEHPLSPTVDLPESVAPPVTGIAERASCRRFAPEAITLGQLAAVLDAAYGMAEAMPLGPLEARERPVPSAGGLYPLELYILSRAVDGLAGGVYHLASVTRQLEQLVDVALPPRLVAEMFLGQPWAGQAAAVLVITAVLSRSLKKYGDRGYRYLLLEAGHVAQNVNLTATALGLGTCNFGGFFDDELAAVLNVDPELEPPLYGIAVGRPATPDRNEARQTP